MAYSNDPAPMDVMDIVAEATAILYVHESIVRVAMTQLEIELFADNG